MSEVRPALDELCEQLARAEQEFLCAEMIDETARMYRERERWAAEITRLRAEIARELRITKGWPR